MRTLIHDKKYNFKYMFDTETGAYLRTGILDEHGKDTGVDPFMGSFPHLIDVGIMGHCIHGKTGLCVKAGIGCYQSGLLIEKPNMRYEDFESIVEQCRGKVNQFALGGRGDPDQHEDFEKILKLCRENNIVPNFTTSGYGMTPEIAQDYGVTKLVPPACVQGKPLDLAKVLREYKVQLVSVRTLGRWLPLTDGRELTANDLIVAAGSPAALEKFTEG